MSSAKENKSTKNQPSKTKKMYPQYRDLGFSESSWICWIICIHIYTYIYIHTHLYIQVYMYIYAYLYMDIFIYMCRPYTKGT